MELTKPKKPRSRKIAWEAEPAPLPGTDQTQRRINPALNKIYWYPNRPTLMPADPTNIFNPSRVYIDSLEASKLYVAELKWNGDNTLVYTDTDKWWNRHKEPLKYCPSPEVRDEMHKVFPKGCIVNAETVNRCTKNIKDKIVVHCLMAYKGHLLMGKTWGDQRKLLEDLDFSGCRHVELSQTHTTGFWDLFQYAWRQDESIEGIILKNPKGRLVFATKSIADVSWMLKIRKPCKKYVV
jgi:hypothetical protein